LFPQPKNLHIWGLQRRYKMKRVHNL
jgi:hypothetical protein